MILRALGWGGRFCAWLIFWPVGLLLSVRRGKRKLHAETMREIRAVRHAAGAQGAPQAPPIAPLGHMPPPPAYPVPYDIAAPSAPGWHHPSVYPPPPAARVWPESLPLRRPEDAPPPLPYWPRGVDADDSEGAR